MASMICPFIVINPGREPERQHKVFMVKPAHKDGFAKFSLLTHCYLG